MKLPFVFLLFLVLLSPKGYSQSDFNKTVRDSEAFRKVAEKLELEPGSMHIIMTSYVIEVDGSLSNITASSEYPEFEPEAIRIISTLPKHQVQLNTGRPYIPQKIKLPITYRVETAAQKKLRLRKETRIKNKN